MVAEQLGQDPDAFARDYRGLKKGDMALNRVMFLEEHLKNDIQRMLKLFKAAGVPLKNVDSVSSDSKIVHNALARWEVMKNSG